MRVYSFLPSATEMVYALGLGDQLCGVTNECDYPPDARSKPVVVQSLLDPTTMRQDEIDWRVVDDMSHGHGLYRINRDVLLKYRPDVIITQELCDVCSVSLRDVLKTVSELSTQCTVLSLKPGGLEGMLQDILTVGAACGVKEKAEELTDSLRRRIAAIRDAAVGLPRRRVFCVEWYDPLFAAGHWVPEMVALAGGLEVLGRPGEVSRRASWPEVIRADPELILLIPCGFGADRAVSDAELLTRLEGWDELKAVRDGEVYAADGSAYFSRPGPRLVDGLELLAKVIHPEVFGREVDPRRVVRLGARTYDVST
ncbi:MAG: cobalamin-binding protein [Nitrososphaerota archaeon]|nr:cobalamin-binding protein [Nitrososphaerota archaeon]